MWWLWQWKDSWQSIPVNVSSYGHFGFSELHRDSQAGGRQEERMDGWVGGRVVGCSAGWQGAAAAVTPRGAAELHKEGRKGKTDVDNPVSFPLLPVSPSPWLVRGRK